MSAVSWTNGRRSASPSATDRVGRDRHGRARSQRQRRCDERLCTVGVHQCGTGCRGGPAEVDEADRIAFDHEMSVVDLAVADAGAVQRVQCVPHLPRHGRGEALGDGIEGGTDRSQHEQDVVTGGGSRRDHRLGEQSGLACEQGEERLVLDLAHPVDRSR